ncbi:TPA: elongation factor Ts [Patescibacteria group bacterium]|nr:elongation factor Ts [Patescibacteria group bacterium]
MVTIDQITKLRADTGAGMMDAKKALQEAKGDFDKAVKILREQGLKIAQGKSGRATSQGLIEAYIHAGGRVGALVQVVCETDFVARTDKFKELAHDIAMQVAAANPQYVSPTDVPAKVLEQEKDIYRKQLADDGKKGDMVEKILDGKLEKFFSEVCLLKQPYIKDDKKKIEDLVNEAVTTLGENIKVVNFSRFSL